MGTGAPCCCGVSYVLIFLAGHCLALDGKSWNQLCEEPLTQLEGINVLQGDGDMELVDLRPKFHPTRCNYNIRVPCDCETLIITQNLSHAFSFHYMLLTQGSIVGDGQWYYLNVDTSNRVIKIQVRYYKNDTSYVSSMYQLNIFRDQNPLQKCSDPDTQLVQIGTSTIHLSYAHAYTLFAPSCALVNLVRFNTDGLRFVVCRDYFLCGRPRVCARRVSLIWT
jgi:hypothetical protein